MSFCAVINCIDGRVQLPVIKYLQRRFKVDNVDTITEAGPNLILSEQNQHDKIQSIYDRLDISIKHHKSATVAIVGHHDCAGNPAPEVTQIRHLHQAIQVLQERYKGIEVIGLWLNDKFEVQEIR